MWDARGRPPSALFFTVSQCALSFFQFNETLLIAKMLWEVCAAVKSHQKERSNAVFGNGNGVTDLKKQRVTLLVTEKSNSVT